MPAQGFLAYESGAWEINLARRELRLRGKPVPLGGRAFDIIEVLIQSAGEVVTKDDLMSRVWPHVTVGENTIQVHLSAVRKALGADRWMLKTTTGRGYRLLGDWWSRQESMAAAAVPPPTEPRSFQTNFPTAGADLIGRNVAVQQLRDVLSAYRIVTLTGPGGIGKTILALQVARRILGEYADGAWLVELASLSDPGLVPSTLAQVLRLGLGGGDITAETVARAISNRHLLLILDNCEHLIEAVAILAETLLHVCPRVTVLTTSREVLRIQGEYGYRVQPLGVPAIGQNEPSEILGHSAPELFIARAKELGSDFSSSATNLATIAAICRHLDGIPLAIEFAAARAATVGIELVAAGLRNRLALLTSGRRTALPRHRTLRATLDWSYELLPEAERLLLRRLAIFPAGFTVDAAAAVMEDTGFDAAAVADGIANLVSKSLVAPGGTQGATRWTLLETIRAYALEKLTEHGEAAAVSGRHAVYFRDLLTPPASGASSSLSGDDLTRCVRELDNVRAALDWSFAPAGDPAIGVDLTVAYTPVWQHLLLMKECRERCERALLSLEPRVSANTRPRMLLQIALAGAMFITLGAADEAKAILSEALDTAGTLNDNDAQTRALAALRTFYVHRGEYGPARILAERIKEIADRSDDPVSLRVAWRNIGTALLTSGKPREAQEYFERVLRSPIAPGDRRGTIFFNSHNHALTRAMLARALWIQGLTERALTEAYASLEDLHGADHQLLLCRILYYGICRITPMIGDFATADREITRLIELATSLNADFWQTAGRFLKGKLLIERGEFAQGLALLRDAFETCDRTGWRLSYPEFKGALALAYAGLGRLDESLDALEDAVASAGGGEYGQVWYVPELLRIKGEILLQRAADHSVQVAEDCFKQAAEMARTQDALFWELRIALSVARLRVTQGRPEVARQMLAPVYDRFTEGFATTDLMAARALLGELVI